MAAANDNNLVLTVSSDMSAAERGIKKFVGTIAHGTSQIEKQFDKMGKGIDNSMATAMQARIDKMVGIGTKGAKEWTGALADQGKELERLRARYSPLFSTLNTYKQTVSDIRRAHAVGAISATEMTAAITRERQAALASTAAIKGRNKALADTPSGRGMGNRAFNTSNLAAQGFDVLTTAGSLPFYTVALQQGPQVAAVFNDIRASGQAIGPAVAGAFAQILNPVSLLTIGVIGATAAAATYFSTMEWGGGKSEETLKKEAELIDAVTQKWGEALPALKAYNDAREQLAGNADIKEAANIAASDQWEPLRKQIDDINIGFTDMASRLAQMGADAGLVGDLQRAFDDLAKGIADGTATSEQAKKVQDELLKLVKETGNPEIEAFAKTFDALGIAIGNASGKASKFKTEAAVLVDLVKQLGPLGRLSPIISGDGRFMTNPNDIQTYRAEQERLRQENANPTVINPDGRRVGVPVPGEKPIQLGDEPNKKAETAAQRAANAYRDLLKSADDRIAQLRLETELLGEYGTATEAARFRLDLLQQAEDKGRSLSETQRAQIEEKVEAYRKYAEALSEAKLRQDLLDKARMAGLTEREKEISQALRDYGLPDDLGSKNAGLIRDQLQRDDVTNAADAFIDDFTGALLEGGDEIGKRLGQVILSALMDSAQQQLSGLLKQIFSALMSGGKGSATSPVASVASAFTAPVGAVSRSVLPSVSAKFASAGLTKTGIPLAGISAANGLTAKVSAEYADRFQGLLNDLDKAGYSIRSLGEGGYSYRNVAGTNNLSKHSFGEALDINPRQNPWSHNFQTDMPANINELAKQNGLTWGGMWNKPDTMHFQVDKSANSASAALEKLAGASTETTKGLGSLASSLASGASGGGAGFGGFNWGSLFSSSFKPTTTLGNFLQGIPGFDGGGHTGMGARSGGLDGKGGFLALMHPRETVTDHTKVSAPRAPSLRARSAANTNGGSSNSLTVNINGASGDPHVKELVRQGVQEALAGQQEQMRRGGFGDMQDRYVSQRR